MSIVIRKNAKIQEHNKALSYTITARNAEKSVVNANVKAVMNTVVMKTIMRWEMPPRKQ